MALLVTGAMGHIGYETVRQARAAGLEVAAQYRTTFRPTDAAAIAGVDWIACELADADAVERLASRHRIDACIHLAALSNEAYARPQPLTAVNANIAATAHLLEAARRHGWRRFIYVSTGSVFQNRADTTSAIPEDAPATPANVYATTKYCGELITRMYRSQFGLSCAVVRISWIYGPPIVTDSPTRGPIPALLGAALSGTPVRAPSGADFAASFTFVGDAAAGLLAAAGAVRLAFDVYHLGPGVNFSAGEVAAAIRAAVPGAVIELGPGTEPWTTYTPMRGPLAGDRLRADTGFAVRRSLAEGVHAYARWLRARPATS